MSLQGFQSVQDKQPTQYQLKPEVRMSRYLETSTATQVAEILVHHRRSCVSSWTKSVWSPTHLPDYCGKDNLKTVLLWLEWEKYRFGNIYLCIESKVYSCLYTWMTSKWLKEGKTSILCRRNWWNWLTWENRHHFLTTCTWDTINVNANRTKVSLRNTKRCSNHESPLEQLKSHLVGNSLSRKPSLGLTAWKVMRRNAWTDFVNLRIKTLSNSIKSLFHAWMIMSSKMKNWKRLENCKKCALTRPEMPLFCTNWWTRHSMVRKQTGTSRHKNGQELVKNAWFVWSLTFKIRAITDKIAKWVILHSIVEWDCSKSQTLLGTL